MINILLWILGALCALYLFFDFLLVYTWCNKSTPPRALPEAPPVSIIIIARNESAHIAACIQSILDNQYPAAREIIVVDDHSTDNTADIVKALATQEVKLLSLHNFPLLHHYENAYKKAGLHYALEEASYQRIVMTDADCIVSPKWLYTAQQYTAYDVVTGPIAFTSPQPNTLLMRFQQLELAGTMAFTHLGIYWSKFYGANAANFSFWKSDYLLFLKSEHHPYASGDDMFFVQWAARVNKRIAFAQSESAIVHTWAQSSWTALYHQRLRWATKSKAYQDRNLQLLLAIIYLWNIGLFASILLFPFALYWKIFCIVAWNIKLIGDFLILKNLSHFFGYNVSIFRFPLLALCHVLYILIFGLVGIFPQRYSWKDRTLR